MAGERLSVVLIGGLAAAAAVQPEVGCVTPDQTAPLVEEVGDLLTDLGPEVVVPSVERFREAAVALGDASAAWEAAAGSGSGAAERELAQQAWIDAMEVWQEAEVLQIGPAAPALTAVGGQDLRDEIYSWPTINPCRVDQETVEGAFDEPAYFTENLVNTYGLDALEHLLFSGDDNACPPQVEINAEGSWDALGPDGVALQRARFATALADQLVVTADLLLDGWADDGAAFGDQLANPGTEASPFADQTEALNAVFDGLFYLEKTTKDRKLAVPLGMGDCTLDCELQVEALPSGTSHLWIAANLRGFQAAFTGGDGAGFDDLLREEGHGDLAERILQDTADALALAERIDRPLDTLVVSDPAAVQELHDAVKRVTDDLKGDLATVLALQIPAEAAGDND